MSKKVAKIATSAEIKDSTEAATKTDIEIKLNHLQQNPCKKVEP
mgnify:CR=1 FL=1